MSPLLDHLVHFGVSPTEKILRTVAVYGFLLFSLRIFGKRELGQLNQFDLVVLLLLSNTLQNAIIGDDVSLTGGLLGAFVLLVANAGVVRWIHRNSWADRLLEGSPDVLIRRGRVLDHRLDRELISRAELAAAARRQGIESLDRVEWCRLEVGGSLSFVPKEPTDTHLRHGELTERLAAIEANQQAILARLALVAGPLPGPLPAPQRAPEAG